MDLKCLRGMSKLTKLMSVTAIACKLGHGAAGKTIIIGMKERGGHLVTEVIPDVKTATLGEAAFSNIKSSSRISTDELYSYGLLNGAGFVQGTVARGKKEHAQRRSREQGRGLLETI
jgi:hypothetical protein